MESKINLTLAELRSATSRFETVLLALLHSGIAGEEPGLFQGRTQVLAVILEQCPGHAMADGASLPGYAAAGNPAHDVKLALCAGQGQGLRTIYFRVSRPK